MDTNQNLTNNQEWNMNKIFGHYYALFSVQARLDAGAGAGIVRVNDQNVIRRMISR